MRQTTDARERLMRAECEFESLAPGTELIVQDGTAAQFLMCDGETVRGWSAAADAAERIVRFVRNQLSVYW